MTKEPTIRAIPANASSRYWKNASPSLTYEAAALPAASPVSIWADAGSSGLTWSAT
jgi:hypothetical protein